MHQHRSGRRRRCAGDGTATARCSLGLQCARAVRSLETLTAVVRAGCASRASFLQNGRSRSVRWVGLVDLKGTRYRNCARISGCSRLASSVRSTANTVLFASFIVQLILLTTFASVVFTKTIVVRYNPSSLVLTARPTASIHANRQTRKPRGAQIRIERPRNAHLDAVRPGDHAVA